MSRVPDNIIVVFDEAYFEFLDDPPDTLRFIRDRRNVVVLRTFSKIHGLAGLRIGYAIAPPEMTEVLHKTRQPFNVNSIAQAGAIAALDDEAHLCETKRVIDEGRAYFQGQFAEMQIPFVPCRCKLCDGKRRRWLCGVPESCCKRKSSCGRSKAMICLNGPHFRRHNGRKPAVDRGTEGNHPPPQVGAVLRAGRRSAPSLPDRGQIIWQPERLPYNLDSDS